MIRIEVPYNPWPFDDPAEIERRILEAAREQMASTRAAYLDSGYFLKHAEPELKRHIRWLYLRICPEEDSGLPASWGAIARREGVGVTTVTRVVTALAREMGVSLPSLPPGRRPKFAQ